MSLAITSSNVAICKPRFHGDTIDFVTSIVTVRHCRYLRCTRDSLAKIGYYAMN